AAQALCAGDYDLGPSTLLDHERRGPRRILGAGHAPALGAGAFVQGYEERSFFVVPVDDQGLAVQDRGAALAVSVLGVHLAEILFPQQLAVGVQAVETAGAEECEHPRAIGDRRGRRHTAGNMTRFVWQFLVYGALPEDFSVAAADGQHHKLVPLGQGQIVMGAWAIRVAGLHGLPVRDRRREEEVLTPDDGRGMPLARYCRLPADVLGLAPL